jgi:filamentous hemagglutinin
MLLWAVSQWGVATHAATQLPVPCAPGACAATKSFVTSGAATAVQSGTTLSVNQTSNTATLNWSSFNISSTGKVVFKQPSSNAIALNRIYDSNPSSIFGALTANGQIFLINANGFVFGSTTRINTAGIIASSLNITDSTFSSGILSPLQNAKPALEPFTGNSQNFATDTTATGTPGTPITNTGSITVDDGAQITATGGGRVLLAAPTVQNGGTLTAADGQVVLAAGQSIFLQASSDPSLRGLIVQVDGTGTVTNQSTGTLSASTGNISLVGLAVNQNGRISATTSVSANGSVTLEAAEGAVIDTTTGGPMKAQQGGNLTVGADSSIDVLPTYGDTATAVAAQTQLQSTVNLTGQTVVMQGGSIDAPSGVLTVVAEANPSKGAQSGGNSLAHISIDSGTNINLAGSDATLPMDANLVTVQLRSNEFADDPTQRNGALRGQTVTVDMRADGGNGTPIANVSSAIAAVGQNISQRTETGGTASFVSEGDVVFNKGASINVSGGATTYLGGTIQTTALVGANGQLYDIGSANPLLTYTGLVNPTFTQTYDQWGVQEVIPTTTLSHYQSTYQQGAQAGSVQFAAPAMVLAGSLKGSAINGPYQRGPVGTPVNGVVPFGDAVPGGTLIIGDPTGAVSNSLQTDYLAPSIEVTAQQTPVVVADNAALPPQTLQLPVSYLTGDGFTNEQIYSNSTFTLPAGLPLTLPAGSTLAVNASRIDVDSSITALEGTLNFQSLLTIADQNPDDPTLGPGYSRLGIGIGNGVTLNVSGQWTNDGLLAGGLGSAPTLQNAGSISLKLTQPGNELALGNNVSLEANGGAWEQASGTLTYGTGGSITLDASPGQAAVQFGQALSVEAFGAGTAAGGSFNLLAPNIEISQGSGSAWTKAQNVDTLSSSGQALQLYAPLFSSDGFSSVSLTATGAPASNLSEDVLTVAAGTHITAQAQSLQLNPGFENLATGGTIAGISKLISLPGYQQSPTHVSLNVARGNDDFTLGMLGYEALDVQSGASITTDPGGSISLSGQGNIIVAGTLRAPGGSVTVQTIAPPQNYTTNTGGQNQMDPGYLPDLAITLAPTALIDVSGGNAVMTPNDQGLLLGSVLPGGSVDITAQRGSVIIEPKSQIDFAGTQAVLDVANPAPLGGYTRETVATAGGSLTVSSIESIELLGSLDGKAGVGNSGTAAAGLLEIDLARTGTPPLGQPDNQATMQIDLVGSTANLGVTPPLVNEATLGVTQLENSGIDALILAAGGPATASVGTAGAQGNISFDTSQPLSLAREIVFASQSLSVADGISANIAAPYIEIGNPVTSGSSAAALPLASLATGTGTLNVSASQQMTLQGNVALQGIASAKLVSQGDVQLQGEGVSSSSAGGLEVGSLQTAGNLIIDASRVYADTFTQFTIAAQSSGTGGASSGAASNTGNTVTIGQTTASPGAPLSAGSILNVQADNIDISGTLLAPFGQINLTAGQSLKLGAGSLVSVSGSGLDVPYGQTEENGAQWIYTLPGGTTTVTGVPTKQVSLAGASVTVSSGSSINLQGGGNLYAYEWVPGTGGSADALASPSGGGVPGLYAILPSQRGQAAPYDPQESGSGIYNETQTVYLTGGAGLPAGYYALLPPRYALEPGAMLVQVEPSFSSAVGGKIGSLADGTPVVAGYVSAGTTGLHVASSPGTGLTEYEGFAIYPGSYGQQLAAYNVSDASSYFTAAATEAGTGPVPITADAGSLTFTVVQSLNNSFDLQKGSNVLTAAASGGRGAVVNISAPNLEICGSACSAVTPPAGGGAITVSGSVLQSWNASELTLGGTSTLDGGSIAVTANNVTVDSGVNLTADQILLVAQQSIDVKGGASLYSTSGKNGKVLATLPALEDVTLLGANGSALPQAALLAVSDVELPVVTRSGSGGSPATIDLESGSHLSTGGSLAVDAPGNVTLGGTLSAKGASWSLSSASIGLGTDASADSLNLGTGLLANLEQAGAVRIASQGSIDIFAPVQLGASSASAVPTLSSLTLSGTEINNETTQNSVFGGASLTLSGVNSGSTTPALGTGTLTLVANTLNLVGDTSNTDPYLMAVSGFSRTAMQVAGAMASTGAGGLNIAGDTIINAVELTPGAGSSTTIATTGALSIGAPTTARAGTHVTTLVGGALSLQANSIDDAGVIAAPSGVVELQATGGDIHLGSTAAIDVAGTLLQAVNRSAASPGGMVTLDATGNVSLDAGSNINVAGKSLTGSNVSGQQAAPAGSLSIVGGGVVTLAGALNGDAGAGGTGGSFSLDAGQLAGGLTPLVSSLMKGANGGFSDAVDIRVRGGDLDLGAGSTLSANNVTLTADSGAVNIAGDVTANSAAQKGFIALNGGTGVTLEASGQLHADAHGNNASGGEIDINSTCTGCSITLDAGSLITTLAASPAQMGELVLRAPALTATNDVAINQSNPGSGLGANVSQVGQVIVEPVMVFATGSSGGSGDVNADIANDVQTMSNFLSTASTNIASRLSGTNVMVQGGVELQDSVASDVLTLQSFDLSQYSTSAQPQVINLGLRSAGSINIQGTISDGFTGDPFYGLLTLTTTPSASLSFVAGADLSSANPLAVALSPNANLVLMTSNTPADGTNDGVGPAVVRTGTGDINLVASGTVQFQGGTSVYTGGDMPANVANSQMLQNETNALNGANGIVLQSFGAGGGNVRISAGQDVVETTPLSQYNNGNSDNQNYSASGWLLRQGGGPEQNPAQYGINYAAFDWNVGALGGGDVTISAARNVSNISAATADSLVDGSNTVNGVTTLYGAGGGLAITAGGDIGSAQVYVANGVGTLSAGGGLVSTQSVQAVGGKSAAVGSAIALGDAQVSVWARNDVIVNAIYDPTFVSQAQGASAQVAGSYFTYGADSAINLSSTAGAVTLDVQNPTATLALVGGGTYSANSGAFAVLPPNLSIQALQNDVVLGQGVSYMYPAANGQLSLFAGQDIQSSGGIAMSDSTLSTLPSVTDPNLSGSTGLFTFEGLSEFQGVIHAGDSTPAMITAGQDIDDLALSVPKAADVVAGGDIENLTYAGQNTSASDITLISAGRDILYTNNAAGSSGIQVGGPGSLDVMAGRNINLAAVQGIATTGNLFNGNLPSSQGADVSVMVGYGSGGADLSGFLKQIIDPSTSYQGELVAYVEELTGKSGLTYPQAETQFAGFSTAQQSALIDNVFFNELLVSGRAANGTTGVGFSEGYAAIDALFPGSRSTSGTSPYSGDLTLTASQIYTYSGGNISLMVPGGAINVGLANPPVGFAQKPASQLGIVAEGPGNVDIYSLSDVNVNTSRIFTLGGGNILIWSTLGNIDAGNGSKSSLSVPPPVLVVNQNGTIQLDFAGTLSSGSGIRTIEAGPDVPLGSVDLDAPVGTVDAGDAGIGAAGNINIAAAHVIGINNISFGGTATGVPPEVGNLSASLSAASSVASGTTSNAESSMESESNAAKQMAPMAQNALSWLDVFVTGLGEENCKPDDLECLKRQPTATP